MPDRCVAAGCGSTRDKEANISLHVIPFFADERPEAKKRRRRWADFVQQKRAKWVPTKNSLICSKHFQSGDFSFRFSQLEGRKTQQKRWLKCDDFGVSVWPTIHVAPEIHVTTSSRAKRKYMRSVSAQGVEPMDDILTKIEEGVSSSELHPEPETTDGEEDPPPGCANCLELEAENKRLKYQLESIRVRLASKNKTIHNLKRQFARRKHSKEEKSERKPLNH